MFRSKKNIFTRGTNMLGLGDFWVFAVYVLCILSAAACVIYGVLKWNSDGQEDNSEQRQWAEEEIKIEKSL